MHITEHNNYMDYWYDSNVIKKYNKKIKISVGTWKTQIIRY